MLIPVAVLISSTSASVLEKRLNSFLKRFFEKAWLIISHAFFALYLLTFLSVGAQAKSSYCSLSAAELKKLAVVKINSVSDGDSLVLSDGRRLRLIHINTPEIHLKQPLAMEAKKALSELLQAKPVVMRIGVKPKDKHGRLLADLYLPDGRSVTATMLSQGWGFLVVLAPNIDDAQCMLDASNEAKKKVLGVWSLSAYQAKSSKTLTSKHMGFQRIKGKLLSFQRSSDYWWLSLEGSVVLRIELDDWVFFDQNALSSSIGRDVLVSGWLVDRGKQEVSNRGRYMLLLSHSAQFEVL